MEVKVILHGNLLNIYSELDEEIILELNSDASVADILIELDINSALVTAIKVDGVQREREFMLQNGTLEKGSEVQLIGPLAGG